MSMAERPPRREVAPRDPVERLVQVGQAWLDEAVGVQHDLERAIARTAEELETAVVAAAAAPAAETPTPTALLVRLFDLARTGAYLWAETGLLTWDRVGRAIRADGSPSPMPAAQSRGLVLATVAADVYGGYLALRDRARRRPGLVGPRDWQAQHRRGAVRVRDAAESLGGVLIKACQFASARPDLLPKAYIDALTPLQDQMPPRPWPTIRAQIAQEIGRPPENHFERLDPAPIAAASIAQVHRGRLAGCLVAVKVRYPDVAEVVAADLVALGQIADAIARAEPTVRLGPIVDYLRRTLPLELDFRREASAMADLRARLAHRDDVLIPEVAQPATERLLVMQWIDGVKVSDRAGLAAAGIDPRAVARLLADVYAEQILRLGLLHADPHPGNLVVRPGPRLVLLDHGLTVPLTPPLVDALRAAARALLDGDWDALTKALAAAGLPIGGDFDPLALLHFAGAPLDAAKLDSETLARLGRTIGGLPFELILIGRALGMLDGIIRSLDPELDVLEILSRHV